AAGKGQPAHLCVEKFGLQRRVIGRVRFCLGFGSALVACPNLVAELLKHGGGPNAGTTLNLNRRRTRRPVLPQTTAEGGQGVRFPKLCDNVSGAVGNVGYQSSNSLTSRKNYSGLNVGLRKVRCDTLANKLITFARCFDQALPVEDRDLPPTAQDQTGLLQLRDRVRETWPLHTQQFAEQILGDRHHVAVAASAGLTPQYHPACQPLLDAVPSITSRRYQHLL